MEIFKSIKADLEKYEAQTKYIVEFMEQQAKSIDKEVDGKTYIATQSVIDAKKKSIVDNEDFLKKLEEFEANRTK
jgi:hypothetical protein